MEVLREHRDSVMAVLEAFVYDPLLNWRLMDSKGSAAARSPGVGHLNKSHGRFRSKWHLESWCLKVQLREKSGV